jgi:DNA-binding CsgD family transcriptional regulator
MEEKISLEESKLLLRTFITLGFLFFTVIIADIFLGKSRMLYIPTTVVLCYTIFIYFNLYSKFINVLKFVYIITLTIYFTFLCHYFFLDLFFVAIFCLLFLYSLMLFKDLQRTLLCVFIIINITFLLFLFREHNNFLRSKEGDGNIYIGYLRGITVLAVAVFFYFVRDYWTKKKKIIEEAAFQEDFAETAVYEGINNEEDLKSMFESINRKDNSFMPLFFNTYPQFIEKIVDINPKINETELEVCALIRLGLTTKEIAVATNSTYKAIESIKYRIRKKLSIESKVNLILYFNEI